MILPDLSQSRYMVRVKYRLYQEQGRKCRWCRTTMSWSGNNRGNCRPTYVTLDHIVPRSAGGTDSVKNLVAACYQCNSKRASAPVAQWIERLTSDQNVVGSNPAGGSK